MKKHADIQATFTVEFDDNGTDDLADQAMDAFREILSGGDNAMLFCEVLGPVRDTESLA